MTLRKLSLALCIAAVASLPLSAQIRRGTATGQDNLPSFSEAESTVIATRLYRALLNREADPDGLRGTIDQVRAGGLRARVAEIVSSAEFANNTNPKNAEAILEQFYRGLLGRSIDAAGMGRVRNIQEKRYTDEVISIIQSQEFRTQLASAVVSGTSTASGSAGVGTTASVNCQERVTAAIADDLTGYVLIVFDQTNTARNTISGTATDVTDGNRRLTYRCPPGAPATFVYDDGRRARSAQREGEFPNDIVRSCVGEIRSKVQQQRGTAQVIFDSAGLMPGPDGTQAVRGQAFERSASGADGANLFFSCDMRGTQILVSSFRMR